MLTDQSTTEELQIVDFDTDHFWQN